jgi:hypothetical protein
MVGNTHGRALEGTYCMIVRRSIFYPEPWLVTSYRSAQISCSQIVGSDAASANPGFGRWHAHASDDLVALLAFHVLLYPPQANTGSTSVLIDELDAGGFKGAPKGRIIRDGHRRLSLG